MIDVMQFEAARLVAWMFQFLAGFIDQIPA